MVKLYKTEQEAFWSSEFGDNYIERNRGEELLASNLAYFAKVLNRCAGVASIMEIGANIGMNLKALQQLLPHAELHAVEINTDAAEALKKVISAERVTVGSILDHQPEQMYDLVLTKGVLIHISPEHLAEVYEKIARASRKYVLIGEYYNPTPVSLDYRGHQDKLFKRDFCGEFMDAHPQFSLLDYGFCYRRDPKFPQDDISWFLLGK